jgi:hypothetical protein
MHQLYKNALQAVWKLTTEPRSVENIRGEICLMATEGR